MGILTTLYFFGGAPFDMPKPKHIICFKRFFWGHQPILFFPLAKVACDVFKGWSPKNWTSAYILRLPCKTLGSSEWGQCNCHQPCYWLSQWITGDATWLTSRKSNVENGTVSLHRSFWNSSSSQPSQLQWLANFPSMAGDCTGLPTSHCYRKNASIHI